MKDYEWNRIYHLLEPRLNQIGEIRTKDAWELVKWPYGMVSMVFKQVMETMMEQKKAIKISKGKYKILRSNERSI